MKLLEPHEAAEILHVHRRTVARWADAGKIEHVRTPGGHRRYTSTSVRALAATGQPARPDDDEPDLASEIPFLHRYLSATE